MRLWPKSLIGRAMLIVGATVALQVLASLSFYQVIDREAMREDHARRIAELLVVGDRVHRQLSADADVARIMSTSYLDAAISTKPPTPPRVKDPDAEAIHRYMIYWEPELARRELSLWTLRSRSGSEDLIGSMQFSDGRWLTFRSHDFAPAWPLALRLGATTLLFSAATLLFAFYMLRQLGQPLRHLAEAARRVGSGPADHVAIEGSSELRDVGRAFNDMQDRIVGLLEDQARAMEAVSHDFRTPLARLSLAAEFIETPEAKTIVLDNVSELDGMLTSLRDYLRAQHVPSEAEVVDLAGLIRETIAPWKGEVRYEGPASHAITTHRGPLMQALVRLVDNAVRHGGGGVVSLDVSGRAPHIHVRDHGPGIPPEDLPKIYAPFFRADAARGRTTAGFGLGIPTAARLLSRFGGAMKVINCEDGGLLATIRPPLS